MRSISEKMHTLGIERSNAYSHSCKPSFSIRNLKYWYDNANFSHNVDMIFLVQTASRLNILVNLISLTPQKDFDFGDHLCLEGGLQSWDNRSQQCYSSGTYRSKKCFSSIRPYRTILLRSVSPFCFCSPLVVPVGCWVSGLPVFRSLGCPVAETLLPQTFSPVTSWRNTDFAYSHSSRKWSPRQHEGQSSPIRVSQSLDNLCIILL